MIRLMALLMALLFLGGCYVTVYEETKLVSGKHKEGAEMAVAEKSKDVVMVADDQVGIIGTFYEGESKKGAILLHMLGKDRKSWGSFPARLQEEGYNVISIDFRGHGQSGLDMGEFTDGDFNSMVKDVAAAKQVLLENGVEEVYIIGASIGANTALNYAASDKSIKGIVLLSPGLDYRGVKTDASIKLYSGRNLLVVASEDDTYSADSAKKLDSVAPGGQLVLYSGSEHGTDMFSGKPLEELIVQWLKSPSYIEDPGKPTAAEGCRDDDDCVREECCHASSCTTKDKMPDCSDILCSMECSPGTMDCGQGRCVCSSGICEADLGRLLPKEVI
ncbi:MAG: alpha/beta fold hydrolase [Candidatus Woesearchaeota archaeon]